jgi:vitamin B12 transporter
VRRPGVVAAGGLSVSTVIAWRAVPCLLALSLPALAADADVPAVLVVTASRTPLPAATAPASISLIDRETIDRRQSAFAADLLRDVPGVAVSRAGSIGAQTQLRIRGAEANHLLVLIDGIEANDPAGNDEFSFEQLTTADIERIELVRGPQSALWGSDALAGVLNIVTRQPGDDFSARAFAEGGAFDTWYAGGSVGGRVGGARVGLSLSQLDSGGTNVARQGGEEDGYRNRTGTLTIGGAPSEALELNFVARYTDARKDFDGIDSGSVDGDGNFIPGTGLPADDASRSDTDYGYLRAGGTLRLFEGRWTQRLNAAWTTTDTDTRAPTGTGDDGEVLFDNTDTAADKYGLYYQSSVQLSGDTSTGTGQTLTMAIDQEWTEFKQRGAILDPFFPGDQPFDPNQDQDLRNTGLVAEYLARPLEPLVLQLALRHDLNSEFDDITTWRAAAGWTFAGAGTRLRGSYATGQKAPTFVERFGFYANQFVGNPALRPEESRGWELGLDQPLADGRLTASATYFRATLDDEINGLVFDPSAGAFTARNLTGESRRRGVEAAVTATPFADLRLTASYTYTDSRQPDASTGELVREVRRPRHAGSLGAGYRLPGGRADVTANLSYVGSRDDFFFDPATFASSTVRLGDYVLADLAVSYRLTGILTAYARVENLLDEDYEDVYGFNTPGVGAYAGIRAAFGGQGGP